MELRREFLDPGARLVDAVADWLRGRARPDPSGAQSLAHLLVVVPTAQSGRRLRLALARRFATGVLPPRVAMPNALLEDDAARTASAAEELATLAETLLAADLADYPALLPSAPRERGARWALDLAESLLGIHRVLGENALLCSDVTCEAEPERWRDLSRLEAAFFAALEAKGLAPRAKARRAAAAAGCRIAGVEEIVLPGLVDAQPSLMKYLSNSPQPIVALVHAGADEGGRFDEWGRPVETFAAPLPPAAIFPAPTAVVEADDISRFFRAVKPDEALPALAVCDAEMFPELEGAFQNRFADGELTLRNPSRESVARSSLGRLVSGIVALAESGDYDTFSAFARSGDVARWLGGDAAAAEAIGALDAVQNAHLPRTIGDAIDGARAEAAKARHEADRLRFLRLASFAERIRAELDDPFAFLRKIFATVRLDGRNPADRELVAAAEAVRDIRRACASEAIPETWRRALFAKLLKTATYVLEPTERNVLATDGWLEVPWCAEDELVIAGFNEGCVPESVVGHPFLPDALRAALGLVTNEQRARRDSFILAEAVRCRASGAVRVHLHQIAGDKNVMKPSRLLFGGIADGDLPALAMRLYAVTKGNEGAPAKELPAAWRLRLPFPPAERTERERMAPTRLDQYLACPLNFYLREVFGEPSDDRNQELDAQTFGNLCHEALDRFAKEGPKDSTDEREIAAYLEGRVRDLLRAYGDPLPAIIELQGEAAIARLRGFAPHQARRRADGWRIVASEQTLSCTIGRSRTLLRGKVDRIDENERTGELAIIDYKTWDRPKGAEVRSVQLPLYRAMVEASGRYDPEKARHSRAMYCVLARRAEDVVFDEANAWHEGLQSAAEEQIVALLDGIARGVFYDPTRNQELDEIYRDMIWGSVEEGVDPDWLADQRKRRGE